MIIDFHTHVGDLRSPDEMNRIPVSFNNLINRLDDERIEKAVLLPVSVSPEIMQASLFFSNYSDINSLLKDASRYSDRLILFGNLDPRVGCLGNLEPAELDNPPITDFSPFLSRFKELGCVGIGEVTANIPMDDNRVVNLFKQCGNFGMPVLFHGTGPGRGVYGLYDEVGSPRLERLAQEASNTTIVGHGPGFWAEIDGNITLKNKYIYTKGPIRKEGSLVRLLREYPNLYADISANSGFNAISRDKDYGVKFLNEFQDKILYGSDVCYGDKEGRMPQLSYLRELLDNGLISREVFNKITGGNALKILTLYKP